MRVYKTVVLVAVFLAACLVLPAAGKIETRPAQAAERPNVILILADDLDLQLLEEHPADYPNLQKLAAEGTTFENAFVTDSLCCPSRATILRGQYAHNHQVLTNEPPNGGYTRFRDLGLENSTVATWLQSSGYKTTLIGKYLNGYGNTSAVPQGWNDWYSDSLDSTGGKINDNGTVGPYDGYLTDVLANRATQFVQGTAGSGQPFFMFLAPRNPHPNQEPAPRHQDLFAGATSPRPPSFNEPDVRDKPAWIRNQPVLTSDQIASIDSLYRNRLQQMMAVDEMVGRLFGTLQASGELDNTYIVFTSDNGFHMGQHRLLPSKWTAYEEDARVPLIVRGPGVPAGRSLGHMVLNNDFAPTFADLAGAEVPSYVDGRSLKPLLTASPPPTEDWRSAFLEEGRHDSNQQYEALRTEGHLYVEYPKTGERELYDLRADPYQEQSLHATADPAFVAQLEDRLRALRNCATASCRVAEDSAVDDVTPRRL
jgi:N-acetylglucosamine-6-sulfatase